MPEVAAPSASTVDSKLRIFGVGQNHTFIGIYGVHTAFLQKNHHPDIACLSGLLFSISTFRFHKGSQSHSSLSQSQPPMTAK